MKPSKSASVFVPGICYELSGLAKVSAMSQFQRDARAEQAIRSAILALFGEAIEEVEVHAGDDHIERPAFFVTVFLKSTQRPVPSSLWLDTIAAATTALRAIDDDRFVHMAFLAPEYTSADDTRPAA